MNVARKRKASLSATILLCIAIITMATYIMKWALDRHMTATRFYRSSISKSRAEGIMLNRVACCPNSAGCRTSADGKTATISINCSASAATAFTVTISED
ncbi:MAG: hypothetical protein K6357_04330 [Elusimicrobiota bacterium]